MTMFATLFSTVRIAAAQRESSAGTHSGRQTSRYGSGVWCCLLVFCTWTAPADAEVVLVEVPLSPRCTAQGCQRQTAYGSAITLDTLPDGRTRLLTAAHLLRGKTGSIVVHWKDQQRIAAQPLQRERRREIDLAVLVARLPDASPPPPWSHRRRPHASQPSAEAVRLLGFAGPHQPRRLTGRWMTDSDLVTGVRVPQGMSGGAVFDSHGGLAGVIVGVTATGTVMIPSEVVAEWLMQPTAMIGNRPESCLICPAIDGPECRVSDGGTVCRDGPACCDVTDCESWELNDDGRPFLPEHGLPRHDEDATTVGHDAAASAALFQRLQQCELQLQRLSSQQHALNRRTEAIDQTFQRDIARLNQQWLPAVRQLQQELRALQQLSIPVQTLTPDGRVFSEDTVRLGDPIQLRLVPRPSAASSPVHVRREQEQTLEYTD
jgi:hypothetical protein